MPQNSPTTPPIDTSALDYKGQELNSGERIEESLDESWGKLPIARWRNTGRIFVRQLTDNTTSPTVGDSYDSFIVPGFLDGARLVRAELAVTTTSASGGPILVQLAIGSSDLLTTRINLDDGKKLSSLSTTQPVIDEVKSIMRKGDQIDVDIDDIGDGAAFGWHLYLYFQ